MEKVATESQKTPRDVVMMENFHHIFSTLSRLKISCLDKERRDAKYKYTDHLQCYVINSLGQPLEKLNVTILQLLDAKFLDICKTYPYACLIVKPSWLLNLSCLEMRNARPFTLVLA